MKRMLKLASATLVVAVLVATLAALWSPVASAIDLFPDAACAGKGADSAACSGSGSDTISGTDGIILRATNLMAIFGGIASVFVLIIGGFMVVTAGGDSGRISTARKMITYAIIGLVIIALARTIIVFVIGRI